MVTAPDVLVGNGVGLDGLLKETIEEQASGLRGSAVKAEGEFIEIVLEVGIADSTVIGPEPPSLQKRCDPVDSRHGHVGMHSSCPQTLWTMLVSGLGKRDVPGPAVRVDDSSLDHCPLDKRDEAPRRGVIDALHTDAACTPASNFGRDGDEDAICAPSTNFLAFTAQKGLIDLYGAAKPLSTWAHHGSPEFVQPRPGRFVASEAQDSLQAKGANSVLLVGEIPDRLEPDPKGFAGPLEERPRRRRCLTLALGATHESTLRFPSSQPAATRTLESVRPSEPSQVFTAGCLR